MATENKRSSSVSDGLETNHLIVLGSGILTTIAVLLPWVELGNFLGSTTLNGIDLIEANFLFSGAMTIPLSLIAIGLTLGAKGSENARTGEFVIGFVVTAIAITFFLDPGTALGAQTNAGFRLAGGANPTFGVIATLLGGVGMMIGGLIGYY